MTDYSRLQRRLTGRYLVADSMTGDISLVDKSTVTRIMEEDQPFPKKAVLDIGRALAVFAELPEIGKENREFKLIDIAKAAGMNYMTAYNYTQRGIFSPSVRGFGGHGTGEVEARFSWADLFVGGAVGVLRRNGIKAEDLLKVRPLLCGSDEKETKRTGRKVKTSSRP